MTFGGGKTFASPKGIEARASFRIAVSNGRVAPLRAASYDRFFSISGLNMHIGLVHGEYVRSVLVNVNYW